MSVFGRFPPRLQEAIVTRLGWTRLRPVQDLAATAILDGANAVVLAPTAGGKTEAVIFPTLARLMERPPHGVGALYLAPIKALLNNQRDRLGLYTEMVGLRRFVWHGDVGDAARRAFLREPAELLMTTPESLEVMLISQRVPVDALFADLRIVVVDEVHAFAGSDRGAHLMSVLERIAALGRNDVQRIGLSATVGNPQAILDWLSGTSECPRRLIDPPREKRKRQIAVHLQPDLQRLAVEAAGAATGRKSLFFCESRSLAEAVADRMRDRGTDVFVHHSSIAARERAEAEARFHSDRPAAIVCTSTLELGIDVGDLDAVLQADAPSTVSSFLQRMGRTGRRPDQAANTTFFCQTPHSVLQAVAIVELARKGWVEPIVPLTRCWPVLVHQVFAMALADGAISAERIWRQTSHIPDFAGIRRAEFDALIAHMVAGDWLFEAGGLLSLGEAAERRFGRHNFMELFAVFSSPVFYRVRTGKGRDLGSLEQDFVDRLAAGISSFLLAGRAWEVVGIDHEHRTVEVTPAPKGREPAWGGFLPQLLSVELCGEMRAVVAGEADYPYASTAARSAIDDWRQELGPLLRRSALGMRSTEDGLDLWTFAGGRINTTIKLGLQVALGMPVAANNLRVRLRDNTVAADLKRYLAIMADAGWWASPQLQTSLKASLPNYRLSKFQDVLPPDFAQEVVADHLLAAGAASDWLRTIV